MTTIHLCDVLIRTDRLAPIRSQHTGIVTPYRSYRGLGKVLLGVGVLVAGAFVMAWEVML